MADNTESTTPRSAQLEVAAAVARSLLLVPPECVDGQLRTFDMMVAVLGDAWRPDAAVLLREAAALCREAELRERLLRAADHVEGGATTAGTVPQKAAVKSGPLTVWDFHKGLVIRIKRGFRDFSGQEIAPGEVLHFRKMDYFPYDGGHTLHFEEKMIWLADIAPENEPVLRNDRGAYYERVEE